MNRKSAEMEMETRNEMRGGKGTVTIQHLLKKEEFALVDQEGKKALNFQITMAICGLIAFFLCFVLVGFLLLPVVMIVWLIFTIIAAVKTSNGQTYEYPFSFKFIS